MEVVKGPDSEKELTRLMEAYEVPLLRLCAAYLRDRQLAEDAAQDTFIKAYRHLHELKDAGSEKSWLMRIAVNTCRDYRRQSWFKYVDRRVALDSLPEPAWDPTPEQSALSLAVMGLPRKYLDVTLLYYFQNMSTKEISSALGIPQRTVSSRLMRAREKLRIELEKEARSYEGI